jgi:oligopeptide transport system substrate-binding protein
MDGSNYYLSYFNKETYSLFSNSKKYDVETQQTLNGFAFYFNTGNEILSDANVRKALSAALDRNTIVSEVTGTGEVAATGYVPAGVFDADNKTDFREQGGELYKTSSDMETAKSLASGKRGKLTVTYLVPQNEYTTKNYSKWVDYTSTYEAIAKKAGEYWGELGFTIDYKGLSPEKYTEALINRDYDIIGVNVVNGSTDAFSYLAPFAKEYSGSSVVVDNTVANDKEVFNTHYTNIDSSDYSAIIDSVLKTSNRADRTARLHEAEQKLVDLCPATMVFWYSRSFVASKEISKYKTNNYFGYVDMTDLKLKDWRDVNAAEQKVQEERDAAKA